MLVGGGGLKGEEFKSLRRRAILDASGRCECFGRGLSASPRKRPARMHAGTKEMRQVNCSQNCTYKNRLFSGKLTRRLLA